jgi:ADP-ribose pyrophosphatase YjhB (NUDIX family)
MPIAIVAINAISIQDNAILLLKKGDAWVLPGGEPTIGESYYDCLERENVEELPNSRMTISSHYGDFEGITPDTDDVLLAKVFRTKIEGDITPSAEISESRYFKKDELSLIQISEITRSVLDDLVKNDYLQ